MKLSTIIQVLILGILTVSIVCWSFLFQDEYTEVIQRFDIDDNMIYEATEAYPKLSNQITFSVLVCLIFGGFMFWLIYHDFVWGDKCQ